MKNEESESTTEIILVTGGNGGIGGAVVENLVRSGKNVAFTYRVQNEVSKKLVTIDPARARAFPLDLSDREGPKGLVGRIEDEWGPIVGLVNAAGIQEGQLLAMTSDASWERVLDVNLGGTFRCCRAVLGGMVRRRGGAIVNVASLAADHGVAGLSAYAASKAGVLAMTRCLAREVGRRGVRVNAVMPGFVATGMTSGLSEAAIQGLKADECLPSGTSARAVADTVAFLLSEKASAITGQALVVDSGTSA